jgi:hypothetical protein
LFLNDHSFQNVTCNTTFDCWINCHISYCITCWKTHFSIRLVLLCFAPLWESSVFNIPKLLTLVTGHFCFYLDLSISCLISAQVEKKRRRRTSFLFVHQTSVISIGSSPGTGSWGTQSMVWPMFKKKYWDCKY